MKATLSGGAIEIEGPGPGIVAVDGQEAGVPYDLELAIAFDPARDRYLCSSMRATAREGGPPVTDTGLRSIRVGALIWDHVQTWAKVVNERTLVAPGTVKVTMGSLPFPRRLEPPPPGRRGRRQTQEDVDAAAVAYRIAQWCGEPPTKAVSDELRIPLGTARKLVARAKAAGSIPETTP